MKIQSYEMLLNNVEAYEAKRKEDSQKRAAAAAEVEAAKVTLNGLLDQAVSSTEDLSEEVGRAQGRLAIAERKQQRLNEQLGEDGQAPKLSGYSYTTVRSEIITQISDGRLLQDLQPDLDELNELREKYREKVKELLIKRNLMNKELSSIQGNARRITEQFTGEQMDASSFSSIAAQISLTDLRPWLWVESDLQSEMYHIQKAADEEVNGKPREYGIKIENVRTLAPQNSGGQRVVAAE